MQTAKVSKLKASISEYLSRVKAGEEVIVTERGRSIAKIIPLERNETGIPSNLLMLERAGLARIGTTKLSSDFWRTPPPKDRKGLALEYLLKERER